MNHNLSHFASPSWQVDSNGGIWEGVRIKKSGFQDKKKKENFILFKKIKVLLIGGGVEV